MPQDDLLQALPDESACGPDLSFAPEFDAIAELRRADDASLEQGAWVHAHKTADWPGVAAACALLLETRTKDLRLANWWTEARARIDGLMGLDDGLALVAGLVDAHWDGVHPSVEDGDAEPRIGSLRWLPAHLPALVAAAPLTPGLHGTPVTLLEIDAARLRAQTAAQGSADAAAPQAQNILLIDDIQRHVAAQPAGHLGRQVAALLSARGRLDHLQTALDSRLGDDAPAFDAAKDALDAAAAAIQRLARDSGVPIAAPGGTMATSGPVPAAEPNPDAASAPQRPIVTGTGIATSTTAPPAAIDHGPPRTRDEALRQLRDVAAFFRATEPHSPVAYLADKAARWGDMPLHAWLRAVVKDGGSLAHLEELLGIDPPAPPPS